MDANNTPRIVSYGYKSFKVDEAKKRWEAICKFCNVVITETRGTTSGFTKHLQRKHSDIHQKYLTEQSTKADSAQTTMTSLFPMSSEVFATTHPKYNRFAESLVENLVVACGMPFSIVEKPEFKAFIYGLEPRMPMPCRQTLTYTVLPKLAKKRTAAVQDLMDAASTVALTLDIWTDRTNHAYLAITAHTFVHCILQSCLLTFSSFAGSHTGTRIAEEIDKSVRDNKLGGKISHIVTDNASNMKRAIQVLLPHQADDDVDQPDEAVLDDDSLWEDLDAADQEEVTDIVSSKCAVRVACFAHTLQLVVKDGLVKLAAPPVRLAMAKCSKLCNLVHQSALFKGKFEAKFGTGRSLPKPNDTRWNSTFRHLQSIADLHQPSLSSLLTDEDQTHLLLTVKELAIINELIETLLPFADATDLMQGDKTPTIGCVVPSVVAIDSCLVDMATKAIHHAPVIRALSESLRRRFRGLFQRILILPKDGDELSDDAFGSALYPMASVLDPYYGLVWLADHPGSEETKNVLQESIISEVVRQLHQFSGDEDLQTAASSPTSATTSQQASSPPRKRRTLDSSYRQHIVLQTNIPQTDNRSTSSVVMSYIDELPQLTSLYRSGKRTNHWDLFRKDNRFRKLHPLLEKVMCVPATSAPVERVFSHGGIFIRPHRARLGQKVLSELVFSKCNRHLS